MKADIIVAALILACAIAAAFGPPASAQQVPCNPQFQNCN